MALADGIVHQPLVRVPTRMVASTSALGRGRVVTVAVALTDLAIPPLDEHLALLVDGDVPRTVNRLLLRVMDGGETRSLPPLHRYSG